MTPSTTSGRIAKARRREVFWNQVTFVVGCVAVVGIIAAVVAVACQQVMRSAPVVADDSYFPRPEAGATWSGRTQSEPAQFEVMRTAATRLENERGLPSPDAARLIDKTLGLPKALPTFSGIEEIEAKREKIGPVVQAFFAARSVAEKLPYVRDPQRVKPLMEEFYSREPMPEVAYRGLGRAVRVEEPGYRFGYVQAMFDNAAAVTLIIEEVSPEDFRLDWECLVRYGQMAWSDFLRERPAEPKLMRVKASLPDPPIAMAGKDEWLELRHSSDSSAVVAAFRRDDPQLAPMIDQLNQGKWKDVPLTLRLSFPHPVDGGGASDRASITGVQGKGWLILGEK